MRYEETPPLAAIVEPAVAVPIDASGSATAVALRTLAFQIIGFVGLLIAALGLPDTSWVVKVFKIAHSNEAIPLIALACGIIAGGWQQLRGLRKHEGLQVMSMLLPQRIAKSPANPTPAVVTAAKAAIVAIEAPAVNTPPYQGEER